MNRALLIVDVQKDFTEGGSLGVSGGAAVASGVTELLRNGPRYDLVVASRDWHNPDDDNGGHFAAAGEDPDFTDTWPRHCVAGTEGAEYHDSLDVSRIDVHLRKGMGRPDYSAFQGETVSGESLADVLIEAGVTSLDVVGIATDHCVRASSLDALQLGYTVRVLTDLTAGVAPESSAEALKHLAAAGAQIGS